MKRALPFGLALLVIAGVVLVLRFSGGCGTPKTRIAQKRLYQGSATLPADATEWPRWRGPFGDGISRETNLAETWPTDGPAELWSAEVGLGYASPIAAGGRVFVFTMNDGRETLTAFDANTGAIVWNEAGGKGRTSSYPGTRGTPCVDGADIFTLGGAGELTCRDVATGGARWTTNILAETGATALDWGTASSPLVSGNFVFVQVGQGGPVALAVDRTSGKIAWRSEASGIAGYASPILVDVGGMPQLIVFGGKAVYGMDPQTGKTLWQHPWKTDYDVNATTPIHRDGRVFLSSGYGSGSTMIELPKEPGGAPRELWRSQPTQSRFQQVILEGDALYVNSEGTFTVLNWSDGRVLFKDKDNQLKLGLGGSFVRLPGDRLIALGERGRLSLARATPGGLEVISSATPLDGAQIWATPLVYAGRLYLKGEQDLVCYDIAAK